MYFPNNFPVFLLPLGKQLIRVEGKQFEDELTELKNEVDEMSAEKREAAIQKFQEEIKECKAILKCGVCFDRPKEVSSQVLVKPYFLIYLRF